MQDVLDETQMITVILGGETHVFHKLVQPYEQVVYRMAFTVLKNEADAEDAAQEALLKAFRNLKSFRGQAKFSTWLLSITLNEARGRLRQRKLSPTVCLDNSSDGMTPSAALLIRDMRETPLESVERGELHYLLQRAISELPSIYREVLRMRILEGHSIRITARALMSSESTVKVRLHRAYRLLRERMRSAK